MITREKEPPNLEMPFGALDSFVTLGGHRFMYERRALQIRGPWGGDR